MSKYLAHEQLAFELDQEWSQFVFPSFRPLTVTVLV